MIRSRHKNFPKKIIRRYCAGSAASGGHRLRTVRLGRAGALRGHGDLSIANNLGEGMPIREIARLWGLDAASLHHAREFRVAAEKGCAKMAESLNQE